MAILQTLFFLIFGSRAHSNSTNRSLARTKLKLLLSMYKQKWFYKEAINRHATTALVIRSPAKHPLASLAGRSLVVCGALALMMALGLVLNPQWRTQLALSIMPASRLALDSLAQTVETTLPEMVGLSRHTNSRENRQEYASTFTFPSHYIKTVATNKMEADELAVARYIARRYRVAHMATSQLVQAAYHIGREFNLDPLLILSVAAVESSFNPYAESIAGAQGLMQVMTRVHEDKYELLGGKKAALDPWANMRVGAQILQSCIKRAGSLEGGLKLYVGAATNSDSGYGSRVLAERERMRQIINGGEQPAQMTKRPEPASPPLELAVLELAAIEVKPTSTPAIDEAEAADH